MRLALTGALLAALTAAAASANQEHSRDRATHAAEETRTQLTLWLGRAPSDQSQVSVVTPALSTASTMDVEGEVTYAVALRYWEHLSDRPIAQGLARYLAGRIVERLFNLTYQQPGHSYVTPRFFGRLVPWTVRSLRVSRAAAIRGHGREAIAFQSLEAILGWPMLQASLRALANASETPLTRDGVAQVIAAAAGRDLAWFFDVALDPTTRVDYAIQEFTSAGAPAPCASSGCHRTRVVVARLGAAAFTGSSRPPLGQYESGEGITLQVSFADGQEARASWDGRAASRIFEFDSPAAAQSARVDPQGTLLLDETPLDHTRFIASEANAPVGKWLARWLVWLQDALVTYTALL